MIPRSFNASRLVGNLVHDLPHHSGVAYNNGFFLNNTSNGWHIGGNVIDGVAVGPVRHNDNGPDDHTWSVNSFGPKPGEPGFLAATAEKARPRTTEIGSGAGERTEQLSPGVFSAPVSLRYRDS